MFFRMGKWIGLAAIAIAAFVLFQFVFGRPSFDPKKIKGLSVAEQAKLHAAAHFGY